MDNEWLIWMLVGWRLGEGWVEVGWRLGGGWVVCGDMVEILCGSERRSELHSATKLA